MPTLLIIEDGNEYLEFFELFLDEPDLHLLHAVVDTGVQPVGQAVAGGVLYSVGAIFYVAKKIPFNHAVWHLFVLGGGACHFLGIVWHVLPLSAAA